MRYNNRRGNYQVIQAMPCSCPVTSPCSKCFQSGYIFWDDDLPGKMEAGKLLGSKLQEQIVKIRSDRGESLTKLAYEFAVSERVIAKVVS